LRQIAELVEHAANRRPHRAGQWDCFIRPAASAGPILPDGKGPRGTPSRCLKAVEITTSCVLIRDTGCGPCVEQTADKRIAHDVGFPGRSNWIRPACPQQSPSKRRAGGRGPPCPRGLQVDAESPVRWAGEVRYVTEHIDRADAACSKLSGAQYREPRSTA